VIDKDYSSSLLGANLGADLYIVLTGVPKVALDFGKPTQRFIDRMTVAEAEKHMAAGQFPAGSMGPKIDSAIQFVKSSGHQVLITDVEVVREALAGKNGTLIVP
jgi:carbamate kinase